MSTSSWQWQLRDRLGQWMDMHSGVHWLARGKQQQGTIIGSPKAGVATVAEAGTGRHVDLSTSRLTAFTLPGGNVKAPMKASAPNIPKKLSSLSDREVEALYWATRDHPNVPITKWLKIAWEAEKRKINISPSRFPAAGVLADGTPMTVAARSRLMQIRIMEREFGLT